jgi:RNA polymerase sigma-70 factor (ECF subfamily)
LNGELEKALDDNRASLVRIAKQYAGGDDWQDLLQEMSVALWRGLPGFDGRARLSTWVYRVAINTALQFVRRRRPPNAPLDEEPVGALDAGDPMALLESFLGELDPVNRAVLLLDLEGLHRDQIGDVLGISGGAVAVRITRLKRRFTDRYVEAA